MPNKKKKRITKLTYTNTGKDNKIIKNLSVRQGMFIYGDDSLLKMRHMKQTRAVPHTCRYYAIHNIVGVIGGSHQNGTSLLVSVLSHLFFRGYQNLEVSPEKQL